MRANTLACGSVLTGPLGLFWVPFGALEMLYSVFKSVRHQKLIMLRLRYLLPILVLMVFGGWVYSDDLPQPDLGAAIQNLQATLSQLQNEIKGLQSSVKELARGARESRKEKAARAAAPPADGAEKTRAAKNAETAWQRAQDAYERGRRSEDLKAYGSAIESFTEAIDLDRKNDSAFLHRGYAHFYLGDFAMAVSDISRSIELQPNNSRAYAMRASALASSGRTADALADVAQAIQRDPRNAENYLLRANLYEQTGQSQEALTDYSLAIQLAPESAKAYLGRAAIARRLLQGHPAQSGGQCGVCVPGAILSGDGSPATGHRGYQSRHADRPESGRSREFVEQCATHDRYQGGRYQGG
jgi:tetratricopeptide (TPR) repeat protein